MTKPPDSQVHQGEQAHAWDCDFVVSLCWRPCTCSIHPGPNRGVPSEREVLSGSFVIPPGEHVGHTVTVLRPYGVDRTPSHMPRLKHLVRCSCGEERDMDDDAIREVLRG